MGDVRKVGVAVDFSMCSRAALQWAVDNMLRKGDHLILVNIRPDTNSEETEMLLWETTGSPLIPLSEFTDAHVMKKYGTKPDPETLDIVNLVATQKEVVVLMKIFWGDAREKLCEAVDNIPLDCLVVGNRGLGKLKRAILGSVSNYVVNHSSCPVTVVKQHVE
ncbi:universal stress protein PHOS32 [Cynara cardunculus var. scolymus]|uniref:universal stress protein PHOS32 n=1 Tax=Cynara cardunculus var. scolymus TaxID=59895 RepID=UPI000D62A629|nr:universal stress protein PHOS32 [Cynara cardunculus var. scolymus]